MVQDDQQRVQSFDTVYTVGKHHGAPRILKQEVIEVEVLLIFLTVDLCLSQCLHSRLLPGEVNDFRLGLNSHLLHKNFQFGPLFQVLLLLLLKEAGGQAVDHCQGGREHKCLPCWIELCGVKHLQQILQLDEVSSFHHAVGFINNQTPGSK